MNAVVILLVGCAILIAGYVFYGKWLAEQWGVDPNRTTPAHELEDGNDYVPAKAPVLMGHHFSSIAGAGPINGPIQAAVFGWVPVMLWVLIGGIFFGAVHDFGALFASVRNKGQSIGEVIAESIGPRAKKLFLPFSYLTLILVVAAFRIISLRWIDNSATDYRFNAYQFSDGSIRFIALAALLLQPAQTMPNVIILDEPELGLHPYAISQLAEMIKDASIHAQVIIATQSKDLVDHFDIGDISVVEMNKETQATSVTHLDAKEYHLWLQNYTVSELWDKNIIGGRPV